MRSLTRPITAYYQGREARQANPEAADWSKDDLLPYATRPLTTCWIDGWDDETLKRPPLVKWGGLEGRCPECWYGRLLVWFDGVLRCNQYPCYDRNYIERISKTMIQYQGKKQKLRDIDADWNPIGGENPFAEEDFIRLAETAATVSAWDFNCALGDTLRDKFESLEFKIFEMAKVVASKIETEEFFWAAMHSSLASQIEMAIDPNPRRKSFEGMGGRGPKLFGTLMNRVKLYDVPILPTHWIVVGCGDKPKTSEHYARISVANYIW